MDSITFDDDGDPEIGVRILINGWDLIDMVREVEMPFATREGHPDIAGAYSYFGPMFVFSPARHFCGEPANDWTDGTGRIFILSCTCGFPQCWALSACVQIGETKVVWSDFRQFRRGPESKAGEWRYDGFGPFAFDRAMYDLELAKAPAIPKPKPRIRTRNTELAEIFDLGFRRGANDRAAAELSVSAERTSRPDVPAPPERCHDEEDRKAWTEGYLAGHRCGASDAELEGVEEPGAHGMITGFGQDFLERFGFLKPPPGGERPHQTDFET